MNRLDTCPICGSYDFSFKYEGPTCRLPNDGRRWEVDECKQCGHGFMNPQPTWEDLADFYSSSYGAYDPSYGVGDEETAIVEKALETREFRRVKIQPGMRVLDVGCGGGSFLRITKRMGAIVKGVEPVRSARVRPANKGSTCSRGPWTNTSRRRETKIVST